MLDLTLAPFLLEGVLVGHGDANEPLDRFPFVERDGSGDKLGSF